MTTRLCDKVFFLVGDGGYSAPLDFSTAPSGCEKSAVLETSQSRNAIVRFGLLRLNHLRRFSSNQLFLAKQKRHPEGVFFVWWERVDLNHRSRWQQIYSLPPLATREHSHIQFYAFERWGVRFWPNQFALSSKMELVDGLEPPTCWLQISCSTNWATPAFLTVNVIYHTAKALSIFFWVKF